MSDLTKSLLPSGAGEIDLDFALGLTLSGLVSKSETLSDPVRGFSIDLRADRSRADGVGALLSSDLVGDLNGDAFSDLKSCCETFRWIGTA